jgi:ATP adenylyltransferase
MPDSRPIWAPWRIDYLRSDKVQACFFCRDAAAPELDVEHYVIHRGETCFVVLNAYPYKAGHLLVAPYRHVSSLQLLTDEELAESMALLQKAQSVLDAVMQPHAYNMGCNQGKAAGAAVEDHLHWHLVPRWLGDTNFMPIIGNADVVPEALSATAELVRGAWV